jgi:hypothetical protein
MPTESSTPTTSNIPNPNPPATSVRPRPPGITRIPISPQAIKESQAKKTKKPVKRVQFNALDSTQAGESEENKAPSRPNRHIKIQNLQKPPQASTPRSKNLTLGPGEAAVGGGPAISSPMRLKPFPAGTSTTPPASPKRDKTAKFGIFPS